MIMFSKEFSKFINAVAWAENNFEHNRCLRSLLMSGYTQESINANHKEYKKLVRKLEDAYFESDLEIGMGDDQFVDFYGDIIGQGEDYFKMFIDNPIENFSKFDRNSYVPESFVYIFNC
jgi:hypothetical protein